MKHEDDILSKAIEQLRNEPIESQPPQAVVAATLEELAARSVRFRSGTRPVMQLTTKMAAAAAILLLAGYAIGRITAPAGPDVAQLQKDLATAIEPLVRQRVMEDVRQQWQVALVGSYAQLKDDLTRQYHADLNRFAIATLAASNEATNQLITQLTESINAAQTQKMQWVAGVLEQIERKRLTDRTQLAAGIETLAYRTADGLQQTRREMVHLLGNRGQTMQLPETEQNDTTEGIDPWKPES